MQIITLNGQWSFRRFDQDSFALAQVPGCNFLDLERLGLISDPFSMSDDEVYSLVSRHDWVYQKQFNLSAAEIEHQIITLCAKQLDTLCTLSLNGSEVARVCNCHASHRFDVTRFLRVGTNVLTATFFSPVEYVLSAAKRTPAPPNSNGMRGIVHLRKPQCHFGWDWGKYLPLCGITDDIYLELSDFGRIASLRTAQTHTVSPDGVREVKVDVDVTVDVYSSKTADVLPDVALFSPEGVAIDATSTQKMCTVATGADNGADGDGDSTAGHSVTWRVEFVVKNPRLWWTKEFSGLDEQPLYKIEACITHAEQIVDVKSCFIGLRTIELLQNSDEYGRNFCFVLNGEKMFAKGASVIPLDAFITRVTPQDYDALVVSAVQANMNMLRVWGGGYYGSDAFYDSCDRHGVLVWQDFAFACQAYPFFQADFLSNVTSEVESVVERLRSHPSLALWCGNNETESMSVGWLNMPKYIKWTKRYFYSVLPAQLRTLDNRDYIAGSPHGYGFLQGVDADNVGDAHIWAVWLGLHPSTYYQTRHPRFCSEFGFESFPDATTVRTYADGKDFALTSAAVNARQKCKGGNSIIRYYMASRFGVPHSFDDFIYLSQICQSENVRSAVEHFRIEKGRTNGALYWQFNDCYPVCSWSSVDYFGRYKALQYSASHFYKPTHVSLQLCKSTLRAYVGNDTLSALDATLSVSICAYDGKQLFSTSTALSLSKGAVKCAIEQDLRNHFVCHKPIRAYATAHLASASGEILDSSVLLLCPEKVASLPRPHVTKRVRKCDDGRLAVTLCADVFAHFVCLSCAPCGTLNPNGKALNFSDNYFDLLPGESRIVYLSLDGIGKDGIGKEGIGKEDGTDNSSIVHNLDEEALQGLVSVRTYADVQITSNRAKEAFIMAKTLCRPRFLASYVFYGCKPTTCRLPRNITDDTHIANQNYFGDNNNRSDNNDSNNHNKNNGETK